MLPLGDYIEPLLLTLGGLVVFGLDVVVFHVLLETRISGFGLLGLGAAFAGMANLAAVWRERRDAVLWLEERERAARVEGLVNQLEREI